MKKKTEIKTQYDSGEKIFFTSDTHFFHENIIKFCDRPYKDVTEMNRKLIENWNSVVPEDGIVFHLGDFCWGGAPKWKEICSQLNGRIILVLGNHDMKNITPTVKEDCFDWVGFQLKLVIEGRQIYLNHYPFLTYGGAYKDGIDKVWQLFGHVHSSPNMTGEDKPRLAYLMYGQYDVGVDNNNYKPISWSEVKAKVENTAGDIITRENLTENGWTFNDFEYEKFDRELESWNKTVTVGDRTFHCTLRPDSNTPNRKWFVHIDNDVFETVGSMDVETYNQITEFLNLLTK